MKKVNSQIFLIIIAVFLSLILLLKFIKPLVINLRCYRKAQIMNDVIKTSLVEAALKSDPLEDKNRTELINSTFQKCLRDYIMQKNNLIL